MNQAEVLPFGLRAASFVVVVSLAFATGCGQAYYPVRGKVTLADGQPVPGSMVIFEGEAGGKSISARGDVGADGSFEMSTLKPGDGVPAGKYRVSIAPPAAVSAESVGPPPFNAKFTRVESSGLEFEVKPQDNEFPIQVTK